MMMLFMVKMRLLILRCDKPALYATEDNSSSHLKNVYYLMVSAIEEALAAGSVFSQAPVELDSLTVPTLTP